MVEKWAMRGQTMRIFQGRAGVQRECSARTDHVGVSAVAQRGRVGFARPIPGVRLRVRGAQTSLTDSTMRIREQAGQSRGSHHFWLAGMTSVKVNRRVGGICEMHCTLYWSRGAVSTLRGGGQQLERRA